MSAPTGSERPAETTLPPAAAPPRDPPAARPAPPARDPADGRPRSAPAREPATSAPAPPPGAAGAEPAGRSRLPGLPGPDGLVPATGGAWFRAGFFAGLGLLAVYVLALGVRSVADVLVRVLVALFLAISLDPAVRWLTGRGLRRGVAVVIIFLTFAAVLSAFVAAVTPPLVRQFNQLVADAPGYLARFQAQSGRLRELTDRFDLTGRLEGLARGLPGLVGGRLLGFTRRLFGALANGLTVLVLTVYFMLGLPRLRRGAPRLIPVPNRARMAPMLDLVVDKVGAYMIGQLVVSFIAAVSALIALTIIGVPFPLPLAIMVGFTALIPLIGATLGAIVATVVASLTEGLWPTGVLVLGYFIVYQQVENFLIAPRVQRSAVNLSAAAVLLAGLIGATALGLLGALMAIPVAAAAKVVVTERMEEHERAAAAAS
ncbi:MAG TPA: AI-2E family transporter [Actinomycetes bacterium]|nr:AI-2E family transporter [Actinomycetes bacterium]